MSEGALETVRMHHVLVNRESASKSRAKYIGLSCLVVATMLLVAAGHPDRSSLAESGSSSEVKGKALGRVTTKATKSQVLSETKKARSPVLPVASEKAVDMKSPHLTKQSMPSDALASSQTLNEGTDHKVRVRLYMESKCPACKMFTSQYMNKVLHAEGMSRILDFKFVPWGNGKITKDGNVVNTTAGMSSILSQLVVDGDEGKNAAKGVNFYCQHGGAECAGNVYESCTQHLYPDTALSFPVIDCIESRACAEGEKPGENCDGNPADVAPTCIREFGEGMDAAQIRDCVTGPLGAQLLLTNALETEELDPPKQWVPWITVNGKHLGEKNPRDIFLLGKAVCDAYDASGGQQPPEACSTFPSAIPTDPYGRQADSVSEESMSRNWWMVVLGVVAFLAAIAGLYYFFTTAQVPKAEPVAEHV